ncbi:MAG: hypothetical protein K0R22_1360, partial [Sporomusa sp.]|nr:hypothetical protein [Sporomusa sp.]
MLRIVKQFSTKADLVYQTLFEDI